MSLPFFYPPTLLYALILLFFSLLLDYMYPFHRGIFFKLHPVHTCYIMSEEMVKPYATKLYGIFLASACILAHIGLLVIPLYVILTLPSPWRLIAWFIIASWFLKTSFSLKLLVDLGLRAYDTAREKKWDETRYWVQQMVRRNVYELGKEHVLSAAIESLAESLVDGFVSPLFYYPLLGLLGSYLQRLVNTLDGSVGFKTPELRDQGWFSAKLDTLLNFVPARLTVIYIVFASAILGYDWRRAWTISHRDHGLTESLNAGYPMSAIAGALGVRLEKPGYYALGDALKQIEPSDVYRAVKIVLLSAFTHIMVITFITTIFYLSLHSPIL